MLQKHIENDILMSRLHGKENVVTFTTTAATILRRYFQAREEDNTEARKMRLIEAAAKLVRKKHTMY